MTDSVACDTNRTMEDGVGPSELEDQLRIASDELCRSPTSGNDSTSVSPDAVTKTAEWARLLGVANRPNPLDDWDQLYNLNNQSVLRNDCRRLAKALDSKKSVPELESFMTLYCKTRAVEYRKDSGSIEVLEKLLKFDICSDELFNIFFAFTTKYIPKDSKDNSQVFDLLRLILQYHDPQLSSHLDSLKCSPYQYSQKMFSTILASSVEAGTCDVLWHSYIEKGDPFLIFFMILVLLINAREQLFAITVDRREEAVSLLKQLPSQLSKEDVPDFVQLASFYGDRTPQSIREDFHYVLFGANYDDEVGDVSVNKLLCLPVTVQELTRKEDGAVTISPISYFVIDCRSQDAYSNGNIYGSFNLDSQLLVDNPSQFEIGLSSLESFKNDKKFEEHLCFVGYGEESLDQYMYMVLARFLRDEKSHVGLATGGYRALHSFLALTDRLRIISSHNEVKCRECNMGSSKSWSLISKMKDAVISKSVSVKERVNSLVISPVNQGDITHVEPSDRHGKRYRNEPSVFSLEDDSTSADEDGGTVFSSRASGEELLLSEQAEFNEKFACHEISADKTMFESCIALTRTHIHILRCVDGKEGYVTTTARHALSTVIRVTSKKNVPELITFKFGYECGVETKITAVHRFLIPKAGECAKAVKMAIFALRPLSDPLEE